MRPSKRRFRVGRVPSGNTNNGDISKVGITRIYHMNMTATRHKAESVCQPSRVGVLREMMDMLLADSLKNSR